MTWESSVVEHLAKLRAAEGPQFDHHWRMTLRLFPSRGWGGGQATLFDEDGTVAVSALAFFRKACAAAYYDERGVAGSGNGPAIRHFRLDMIRDTDSSSFARRKGRSASASRLAA